MPVLSTPLVHLIISPGQRLSICRTTLCSSIDIDGTEAFCRTKSHSQVCILQCHLSNHYRIICLTMDLLITPAIINYTHPSRLDTNACCDNSKPPKQDFNTSTGPSKTHHSTRLPHTMLSNWEVSTADPHGLGGRVACRCGPHTGKRYP